MAFCDIPRTVSIPNDSNFQQKYCFLNSISGNYARIRSQIDGLPPPPLI